MPSNGKQYRFGFDIWGLLIFLTVMIPNLNRFAGPDLESQILIGLNIKNIIT